MADVPLVILLVKWLLKFIGYLCAVVAIPFTLYSLLVKAILDKKESFTSSSSFYAAMWFPRWVILTSFLPFFVAEVVGLAYGISTVAPDATAAGIGVGFALATIVGFLFTRFDSFLGRTIPKVAFTGKTGYMPAFLTAQVDMIVFFCSIVVVCSLIRVPFLVWYIKNVGTKIRTQIGFQFMMTFVDLFTLPFLLFDFVFFWRLPTIYRNVSKVTQQFQMAPLSESIGVRGVIVAQFFNAIMDIPIFAFGIFFLLTPWRIPIVKEALEDKPTLNQKRKAWIKQLGHMLLDLACTVMGLFVVMTIYRAYAMYYNYRLHQSASDRRTAVCRQFAFIFVDLIAILTGAVVVIFGYRVFTLMDKISRKSWGFYPINQNQNYTGHTRASAQASTIGQFWRLIVDMPFILMGTVVTITLWRALFLWNDIIKNTDTAPKRRKAAARHFALLFVDIMDLPFVIASLIITITVWRAVPFWRGITDKEKTRNKKRLFVLSQFGLWLLDIPTLFGALILMITVYRAKYTIMGLKQVWFTKDTPPAPASKPDLEDNPLPPQRPPSWHHVVGAQFGGLMLDIPFPILIAMTLWRFPWCIKRVVKECETANERRMMILRFLWGTLKDFPCIVLFLFIVCTVWRIPSLFGLYKNYNRGDNEHRLLLGLFVKTIADIPFVLMGLFVCLCLWRGIFLAKAVLTKGTTDRENRSLAAQYFLAVFGDILAVTMGAIIIITVWRIPTYVFFVRHHLIGERENRWKHLISFLVAGLRTLFLLLTDIISIMQICIVFVGVFHVISLTKRMSATRKIRKSGGGENKNPVLADYMPDFRTCENNAESEQEKGAPISLSFYRPLVMVEFFDALRHIPHLVLLPVKAAGLVFMPIHMYLAYRIDKQKYKTVSQQVVFVPSQDPKQAELLVISSPSGRAPSRPNTTSPVLTSVPLLSATSPAPSPALNMQVHSPAREQPSEPEISKVDIEKSQDTTHLYKNDVPESELHDEEDESDTPKSTSEERKGSDSSDSSGSSKSNENNNNNSEPVKPESEKTGMQNSTSYQQLQSSNSTLTIEQDFESSARRISSEIEEDVPDVETAANTEHNMRIASYKVPDTPHVVDLDHHIQTVSQSHKKEEKAFSFLQYPLLWLHAVAAPRMNFWGMDQFFILNAVSLVVVLPNEVAMIPVGVNLAFIFLVTLGSPLWNGLRKKNEWTQLGQAQGLMIPLEIVLLVLQTLLFPAFIFLQFIILFFPIFLISASYFPSPHHWPTFTYFWDSFFTTKSYWHRYHDFYWWFWLLEIYWVVIFAASLHLTLIYSRRVMPLFDPVSAYYWLVKRVFAGRLWGFYKKLLSVPTKWCYNHKKTLGCLGELLMFPLFLAWVGWPIIIPFFTHMLVFIASGIVTCFLIFKGYFIAKENWAGQKEKAEDVPVLTLQSCHVELPPSGGIIFTLTGTKDPNFSITQAKWIFEGREFWRALGDAFGHGVISGVKMTLHPIDLCPAFMDANDLGAGKAEFVMNVRAGVAGSGRPLKHSTVMKKLNVLIRGGDPEFKMVFEHGINRFGWKKAGTLCSFNLKLSDILRVAETKESLVAPQAHSIQMPSYEIPVPPPYVEKTPRRHSPPPRRSSPSPSSSVPSTRVNLQPITHHSPTLTTFAPPPPPMPAAKSPSFTPLPSSPSTNKVVFQSATIMDPRIENLANMMNIPYDEAKAAVVMFDDDLERAANYLLTERNT